VSTGTFGFKKCGKKEITDEELHKLGSLSLRKKLSIRSKERRGSHLLDNDFHHK